MHVDRLQIQDPSSEDIQFLEDRLYDFNTVATGITVRCRRTNTEPDGGCL